MEGVAVSDPCHPLHIPGGTLARSPEPSPASGLRGAGLAEEQGLSRAMRKGGAGGGVPEGDGHPTRCPGREAPPEKGLDAGPQARSQHSAGSSWAFSSPRRPSAPAFATCQRSRPLPSFRALPVFIVALRRRSTSAEGRAASLGPVRTLLRTLLSRGRRSAASSPEAWGEAAELGPCAPSSALSLLSLSSPGSAGTPHGLFLWPAEHFRSPWPLTPDPTLAVQTPLSGPVLPSGPACERMTQIRRRAGSHSGGNVSVCSSPHPAPREGPNATAPPRPLSVTWDNHVSYRGHDKWPQHLATRNNNRLSPPVISAARKFASSLARPLWLGGSLLRLLSAVHQGDAVGGLGQGGKARFQCAVLLGWQGLRLLSSPTSLNGLAAGLLPGK